MLLTLALVFGFALGELALIVALVLIHDRLSVKDIVSPQALLPAVIVAFAGSLAIGYMLSGWAGICGVVLGVAAFLWLVVPAFIPRPPRQDEK